MSDSSTSQKDSLDACLGLAFGADPVNSEISGQSVLQSLGHLMKTVPHVLLRESETEDAIEPFIKPDAAKQFEQHNASRYRIDGEIAEGGMG